ncbi:MAG: ATP-dependent DNA helicase [Actinomycetota bacterium]|nr:ATP-dependent DNA helicase [Actinomycetota bacterium]
MGAEGSEARRALEAIVGALTGGERREGQLEMCDAVAEAIATGCHLIVEAGTGVGKSLAYLVPAVLSGKRVVVATARKPLQDQLIGKDIPFVAAALPGGVDAAVLKGRSNYLCLAKLAEVSEDPQGELLGDARRRSVAPLAEWAETAESGDLADAPFVLDSGLRALLTVSARECPGAAACDHGEACLAERALHRARDAQLVVTNIDLYCLDMSIGGGLLGEHDVVVIDEAHELEAIASRTFGLELGRRRFGWLAGQLRSVLVREADEPKRLEEAGERLARTLSTRSGQRVDVSDDLIAGALAGADEAVAGTVEVLRKLAGKGDRDGRRERCVKAASSLLADVRAARAPKPDEVAWVPEGEEPVLHVAPVDVGPALASLIYTKRTAVLTSATLSVAASLEPMSHRLGLRPELLDGKGVPVRGLRVGSPFPYRRHAYLYVAAHLPDPRRSPGEFDGAALEELAALVEAAGGRTLALFTSHRMLRLAAEALKSRFPWPVLVQEGPPQPRLIQQFREDEQSCLLATMGFWQGVDVPGPALNLVVIDRLPFPPPGDPLLEARREAARLARRNPFEAVDLPLAATQLAQGAGRLIRSATDRGVVAVLDRRLATARYRTALLEALPPFRRTLDRDEVRAFLTALTNERVDPAAGRTEIPAPVHGFPAVVGLGLVLAGGKPGRVVELLPHGAVVELDSGGITVVRWGQPVTHDGRRRPLLAG